MEPEEGSRRRPVSLAGMYPGGLLSEGRVVQKSDEVVICEPHLVTLTEIHEHLGGQGGRDRLLEHLDGFHDWFAGATREDGSAELWVRGNLASTLSLAVEELDLVAIYGPNVSRGHAWL